jgi:hypothetical protein
MLRRDALKCVLGAFGLGAASGHAIASEESRELAPVKPSLPSVLMQPVPWSGESLRVVSDVTLDEFNNIVIHYTEIPCCDCLPSR